MSPNRAHKIAQDLLLSPPPAREDVRSPARGTRNLPPNRREDSFKLAPGIAAWIGYSSRKSRDLDSQLHRNVEQWKSRDRVCRRRGVFKNLGYNPCGYTINKKEPLKLTGSLLVDRRTLRATIGKRRTKVPGAEEIGPREGIEYEDGFALVISEGKLMLKNYHNPAKAYAKNLAFLQGGRKSCGQLKYIASFIVENGITARLYKKVALANLLVRCGKPNPAYRLLRSVSNRCGQLCRKTEHASFVREPSLSDSSSWSDW